MSSGDSPTPDDQDVTAAPAAGYPSAGRARISSRSLRRLKRRRKRVMSSDDLEKDELAARNVLRKGYGWGLLAILACQIAFVDWIFYRYADEGRDWNIESSVMTAWLTATVIEVVGIAAVVVRHLFPRRDKAEDSVAEPVA